jgi:GMP synthase (glutamine-hydrolysing)
MRQRIVLIAHAKPLNDDRASDQVARLGYEPDWRVPCEGDALGPVSDDVAGTIVFGGKYCISDIPELPFMQAEIDWIEACLAAGLPMLGICQGAQMIAHALGAAVGPGPGDLHEFGFYEVSPTPEGRDFLPRPMHMTQAHFHTFDIPQGAVHLAGSTLYPNQAFRWGDKVYGMQFHPEVTPQGFARWQQQDWWLTAPMKPGVQSREDQSRDCARHDAAMDAWFRDFLTGLFGRAA